MFSLATARWRRPSAAVVLALAASVIIAAASAANLTSAATYARETPAWAAQGVAQDWFDLVIAAPLTALAALWAWRGSRRGRLVLAGLLLDDAYNFAIYTFAVHWNPMFLLYCAALGTSVFGLVVQAGELAGGGVERWYRDPPPRRTIGGILIATAVLFAALWLLEDVAALAAGTPPPSLAEVGLLTNPVHVIDLALVLPLHAIAGVALWRGRPLGAWLAPLVLGFGAPMSLSIAGLALASGVYPLAAAMTALAALWIALLALMLRRISS